MDRAKITAKLCEALEKEKSSKCEYSLFLQPFLDLCLYQCFYSTVFSGL